MFVGIGSAGNVRRAGAKHLSLATKELHTLRNRGAKRLAGSRPGLSIPARQMATMAPMCVHCGIAAQASGPRLEGNMLQRQCVWPEVSGNAAELGLREVQKCIAGASREEHTWSNKW